MRYDVVCCGIVWYAVRWCVMLCAKCLCVMMCDALRCVTVRDMLCVMRADICWRVMLCGDMRCMMCYMRQWLMCYACCVMMYNVRLCVMCG